MSAQLLGCQLVSLVISLSNHFSESFKASRRVLSHDEVLYSKCLLQSAYILFQYGLDHSQVTDIYSLDIIRSADNGLIQELLQKGWKEETQARLGFASLPYFASKSELFLLTFKHTTRPLHRAIKV